MDARTKPAGGKANGRGKMMKRATTVTMRVLGIILAAAAVLKGWQLLTEPTAEKDLWTSRALLIFTVEFEIALSIWLLSGLFKRAAWLAALLCFSAFSAVTFYKAVSGAESCGCFGSVHVNPWITLFAVDLPAVLALAVFRPKVNLPKLTSAKAVILEMMAPMPSPVRLAAVFCIGLVLVAVSTVVLALNPPARATASYEVLEPESWVGGELAILDYIDIGDKLRNGNWLVLFYHHDCPDCAEAIRRYEQMAFIQVPPYGRSVVRNNPNYAVGKLLDIKEWFITTPVCVLLMSSEVQMVWHKEVPKLETIKLIPNGVFKQGRIVNGTN